MLCAQFLETTTLSKFWLKGEDVRNPFPWFWRPNMLSDVRHQSLCIINRYVRAQIPHIFKRYAVFQIYTFSFESAAKTALVSFCMATSYAKTSLGCLLRHSHSGICSGFP